MRTFKTIKIQYCSIKGIISQGNASPKQYFSNLCQLNKFVNTIWANKLLSEDDVPLKNNAILELHIPVFEGQPHRA